MDLDRISDSNALDVPFRHIDLGKERRNICNLEKGCADLGIVALLIVPFLDDARTRRRHPRAACLGVCGIQISLCCIQLALRILQGELLIVEAFLGNSACCVELRITRKICLRFFIIRLGIRIEPFGIEKRCIRICPVKDGKDLARADSIAFIDEHLFNASVHLGGDICLPDRIKRPREAELRDDRLSLRISRRHDSDLLLAASVRLGFLRLDIRPDAPADQRQNDRTHDERNRCLFILKVHGHASSQKAAARSCECISFIYCTIQAPSSIEGNGNYSIKIP